MTNLKDSTGVYDIIRQYNASWSAFADLTLFDEITKKNHDDVAFTGERLVINELVKSAHANVLSQHLIRYDLACRFVAGKKSARRSLWIRIRLENVGDIRGRGNTSYRHLGREPKTRAERLCWKPYSLRLR